MRSGPLQSSFWPTNWRTMACHSMHHGNISTCTSILLTGTLHQTAGFRFDQFEYTPPRHRLDISKYGGSRGPAPTYSPILEAWRSGRTTTKQRDYVLAVFPDINGYLVPPAARKKSFHELLTDALTQAPIRTRFDIVSKVPRGMMMQPKSSKDSMAP